MVGEIVYSIHPYSYLNESVAETLADALNWDLGVAVVVAVVVAHSHLGETSFSERRLSCFSGLSFRCFQKNVNVLRLNIFFIIKYIFLYLYGENVL